MYLIKPEVKTVMEIFCNIKNIFNNMKNYIAEKINYSSYVNRKSILMSWLISYLMVLIIPLIGNFFINVYIKNILKIEITNANQLKLDILKDKVDTFFFESERLSNETFFNSDMAKLAEAETIDQDLRYTAKLLGDELQHSFIASMQNMKGYLYLPESDYVLSHGMLIASKEFYDAYYSNSGDTYREWMSNITDKGQYAHSTNSEYYVEGGGTVIENIRPIQLIGQSAEKTVILVTAIGSDTLFEGVDLDDYGASVMIFDSSGTILIDYGYSYGDELFDQIQLDGFEETINFNGEKLVASCIDSDWNDMKYVYVLSEDIFNRKIFTTWTIIILSLVLSFTCGFVIICYAMKKNYKPVRTLMDVMKKIEKPKDVNKNEYQMMKSAVERLIARSNSDASALRKNEEVLGRVYLLRAVMEHRQSAEMRKKLADLGIEFKKPCFCVVILKLDSLGQLSDDIFDDSNNRNMAKYAIYNITEELLSRHFVCGMCETNGTIIFVVNTDGSNDSRSLLMQDLAEAQEEIVGYLGITYFTGVSGTGTGFETLNSLYYDALYALEYSRTVGGGMMDYTEMDSSEENPEYSRIKWNELCGMIKLGDLSSVENMLDDIIQESFEPASTPITVKKGLAYMLISMIMNLAGELGMLNCEIMHKGTECIDEQTALFSPERLRIGTMELCRMICGPIAEKEKEGIAFSDDIIKYIEENYSDYNLNITMIGRAMGLTSSYVSKLFLNQTGTKLLDYINMYRVKKAKELLAGSPGLKIERVGELVGFSVSRSFLRIFKKYTGMSPSAYREDCKK